MRQIEELGQHRHEDLRVRADALVAHPHDIVRQRPDDAREKARHAERVHLAEAVGGDADRLVGAAGEALAQARVGARGAERDRGDRAALRFLRLERLLERVLVVGDTIHLTSASSIETPSAATLIFVSVSGT